MKSVKQGCVGTVEYVFSHIKQRNNKVIVFPVSIVVSIPACHAGDRGSIPRLGVDFLRTLLILAYVANAASNISVQLSFTIILFTLA